MEDGLARRCICADDGRFQRLPLSGGPGGLLGWRDLKAFPKEVQDQMAAMKPGGKTKPAQTQNGIQIFRVEALGSAAEGSSLQELKDMYLTATRQKYLQDLRARSNVEIRIGK